MGLCRLHYTEKLGRRVQNELKKVYGNAEQAFGAIDFSGSGRITQEAFESNLVVKRIPDIQKWLDKERVF